MALSSSSNTFWCPLRLIFAFLWSCQFSLPVASRVSPLPLAFAFLLDGISWWYQASVTPTPAVVKFMFPRYSNTGAVFFMLGHNLCGVAQKSHETSSWAASTYSSAGEVKLLLTKSKRERFSSRATSAEQVDHHVGADGGQRDHRIQCGKGFEVVVDAVCWESIILE